MCLGGGGDATSKSEGRATSNVSFNPVITVGSNQPEPGADTASTFAKALLAAPPVKVALPDAPAANDDKTTTLLIYVAVALAARKVLHG